MDDQQFARICELLGDIMSKLIVLIEMKVEDQKCRSIQSLSRRRELKLEEYRRAYERQHGVIEISSEGEDEID
jgi:hypothetical protein